MVFTPLTKSCRRDAFRTARSLPGMHLALQGRISTRRISRKRLLEKSFARRYGIFPAVLPAEASGGPASRSLCPRELLRPFVPDALAAGDTLVHVNHLAVLGIQQRMGQAGQRRTV